MTFAQGLAQGPGRGDHQERNRNAGVRNQRSSHAAATLRPLLSSAGGPARAARAVASTAAGVGISVVVEVADCLGSARACSQR